MSLLPSSYRSSSYYIVEAALKVILPQLLGGLELQECVTMPGFANEHGHTHKF